MSTFTDDFNRADGGPGNNWTTTGTVLIASNKLTFATGAYAIQGTINAAGRQEAICSVYWAAIADMNGGPLIKATSANQSGYIAVATGSMSAPLWRIHRVATNGSTTVLLSITGGGVSAGTHTVRLLYESGVLTLWVDGYLIGSVADSTYGAQTGAGWRAYTGGGLLDTFTLLGDEAVSFTVDPSPIGNFGSPVALTFTGVTTSWTPGTPGSPTFTVDHGVLTDQVVTSATSATATYTPGNFLGNATFADPSSGATCIVVVTSNLTVLPPGVGQLTTAVVEYLTRSAEAEEDSIIANRNMDVALSGPAITLQNATGSIRLSTMDKTYTESGGTGINKLVWLLYGVLTGFDPLAETFDSPTTHTSVKVDLEAVLAALDTLITSNHWTLGSVITEIAGEGVPQIKDVMDALSGLSAPDLSAITDAIAALRGDDATTVRAVKLSLDGIRGISDYGLVDVKDWIDALPQTQAAATAIAVVALIAALALAAPTGGASVAAAAVAVGAGPVLDIATIVELVGVLGEIAALAAQVAELADNPPSTYVGPPVWPGDALATMGTSVALGAGGTITEAMDGVVVEISATDADHRHAYSYDGVKAYRNIGALAFFDDVGRLEPYQALSFETAIFTPRCLAHAAGVKWFTGHGPIGTIQAWSTTP